MSKDVVLLASELRWLQRAVERLEAQEPNASGAFYTRSEADAKFLTIADAADNYIDISAYGDFLLATGQATGALIFPQIFSRGIVANDGIWGSGAPNGDLVLEGTSDATKASSYVLLQPNGGNVGIGTPTPSEKLEVNGSALIPNNSWYKAKTTGGTAIQLLGIDGNNDVFMGAVGNAGGSVYIREDGSNVITITGGYVGIGMAPSGTNALTANGPIVSSGSNAALVANDRANGTSKAFGLYTTSDIGRIYSWGGSRDVMAFTGAGKVGVGTTAPGTYLELAIPDDLRPGGTAARSSVFRFQGGQGGSIWGQRWNFDVMGYTDPTTSRLMIGAGNNSSGSYATSDLVTILSSGNVGIGRTTPSARLHLATGEHVVPSLFGGELLIVDNNASGTNSDAFFTFLASRNMGFRFGDSGNSSAGYVAYGHSNDMLYLGTNGGTRVTIDSSGNVDGTGYVTLSNSKWFASKNTGGTTIELLGIDSSNNVYLGAVGNAGGKVIIREDGADVITLHTGNVGIGTTNPQNFKLQVEGRVGIKTGVNAASAQLWVYQDDNGGTIPVLRLTQSDLSEEFIYFNATVGTNYPIDTAALGTYYGKVRVSVNGTFKYMPLYNS